jgi:hypothetical protein
MDRQVALLLDEPRLLVNRRRQQGFELRLAQQRMQAAVIGPVQAAVVVVEPVGRLLQRVARPHARHARIGIHQLLRAGRRVKKRGEFGAEELEIAHRDSAQFSSVKLCTRWK